MEQYFYPRTFGFIPARTVFTKYKDYFVSSKIKTLKLTTKNLRFSNAKPISMCRDMQTIFNALYAMPYKNRTYKTKFSNIQCNMGGSIVEHPDFRIKAIENSYIFSKLMNAAYGESMFRHVKYRKLPYMDREKYIDLFDKWVNFAGIQQASIYFMNELDTFLFNDFFDLRIKTTVDRFTLKELEENIKSILKLYTAYDGHGFIMNTVDHFGLTIPSINRTRFSFSKGTLPEWYLYENRSMVAVYTNLQADSLHTTFTVRNSNTHNFTVTLVNDGTGQDVPYTDISIEPNTASSNNS